MSDMGSRTMVRQSPRKDQAIVAFDFDGTLTIRDSFTAFLAGGGVRRGAKHFALAQCETKQFEIVGIILHDQES